MGLNLTSAASAFDAGYLEGCTWRRNGADRENLWISTRVATAGLPAEAPFIDDYRHGFRAGYLGEQPAAA